MQLDPTEKRHIWLKGALKSGLKETLRGLAIGFVAAAVLFGVAQIVGTAAGLGAMLVPMVGASGFSPALLMAFCGVISGVTGLFTGGGAAVEAYHQQKHNLRDEAMLVALDGRTRTIERAVAPSRHVQTILDAGPRHHENFETAELNRAEAPKGPTIH